MDFLKCACVTLVTLMSLATPARAQALPDTDNDGLPDEWERSGHGPLNPFVHPVRVGRPDFILIAVLRPGLSAAVANEQLTRLRDFFARVPTRNPDGSTGINMIVVPGPVLPSRFATTPYTDLELYNAAMPVAWRGLGHGYLLEVGAGGGGQTVSPEWSASGHAWQAVAHELGHQFGLEHAPPGSAGVSPLWPSLMNYSYTYSLGGNPDAVQFSTGSYRSNVLNEGGLNEVQYLPIERLRFLEAEGGFRLRTIASAITAVDWNRNGIFGESNVRADINDLYATGAVTPSLEGPASAGGLSMATVRDRVYVVFPTKFTAASTWNTSEVTGTGGRVSLVEFDGTTLGMTPRRLNARDITGSPNAAAFGTRLAVAYVSAGLPFVGMWDTSSTGLGNGGLEATDFGQRVDQALLAGGRSSPMPTERLWLLTWAAATGRIRAVEVTDARTASETRPRPRIATGASVELSAAGLPLTSTFPIAAAFDAATGKLVVVTYENNTAWMQQNNLKLTTFRLSAGAWVHDATRWVGTATSGWWGSTRPTLVLDQNTLIDGHSQATIYIRGGTLAANTTEQTYKLREIADRTQNDGWRTTTMIDGWNTTQSPPAAAALDGTHVYALRWPFSDSRIPNQIVLYRQTAVVPGNLLDWDEVSFLSTTGMRVALERMRAYHGTP